MKTIYLFTMLAAMAFADEDTCDSFGDWRDWTDKCLWFPVSGVRTKLFEACDVIVNNVEKLPTFPLLPDGFPTEPCGHCGFKARCRKREQKDGCSSVDLEHQHCDDGDAGAVCNLPKIVDSDYSFLGCDYAALPYLLEQCVDRPDIPEWKRQQVKRLRSTAPKFHCSESGDQCKCCCHPYLLNADHTECILHEEPQCEPMKPGTDWSEKCLAFPASQMVEDLGEYTGLHFPYEAIEQPMKGFIEKLPDAGCGMCAFKIKTSIRNKTSKAGKRECFEIDFDKKACGNEECEGCGDICQVPKIDGGCDYNGKFRELLRPTVLFFSEKTPAINAHYLPEASLSLPHGKCVERDDQCMCCCHPYEPNEDGTQCVVKNMCLTAEEAGVTFDMNLSEDI